MTNRYLAKLGRFLKAEDGPTIVEYAILLALMAGMMISAIIYVGSEADAVSSGVVNSLDQALNGK